MSSSHPQGVIWMGWVVWVYMGKGGRLTHSIRGRVYITQSFYAWLFIIIVVIRMPTMHIYMKGEHCPMSPQWSSTLTQKSWPSGLLPLATPRSWGTMPCVWVVCLSKCSVSTFVARYNVPPHMKALGPDKSTRTAPSAGDCVPGLHIIPPDIHCCLGAVCHIPYHDILPCFVRQDRTTYTRTCMCR